MTMQVPIQTSLPVQKPAAVQGLQKQSPTVKPRHEMTAAAAAKLKKLRADEKAASLLALRSWTAAELADAVAWALGSAADEKALESKADLLLTAWAERDFTAAWLAVSSLKKNSNRNKLMGAVLSVLARSNLDQVLTFIGQESSAQERSLIFGHLMDAWGSIDPRSAVLAAFQHPDNMGVSNATAWAAVAAGRQMSLAELTQLAHDTGNPAAAPQLLRNALSRLTREDPEAVWQWYQEHARHGQDPDFALIILRDWWSRDPHGALQAAADLPDGSTKVAALRQMLHSRSSEISRLETAQRVLSTATPDMRLSLLRDIASELADSSTLGQSADLLSVAASPGERDILLTAQMLRLSQDQRFEDAAALLTQLGSDAAREQALRRLGDARAFHDTQAAEAWVRQQPASPARDAALTGIMSHLGASDTRSATALLPLFDSPAARHAALKTIAVQWTRADPAAAQAWLAGQPALSVSDRTWIADAVARGSPAGLFLPDGRWITNIAAP
jgi:hypothetical protein